MVVVAGLVIGSFLTVVVDRVPRGESVVAPPSRAVRAGSAWPARSGPRRELGRAARQVPSVSAPIGIEPIVIELATAGDLRAVRAEVRADTAAAAYCILGAVLVAQTWIDLHTQRLPREITYTGIVLGGDRADDRGDRDRRAGTHLDDGARRRHRARRSCG